MQFGICVGQPISENYGTFPRTFLGSPKPSRSALNIGIVSIRFNVFSPITWLFERVETSQTRNISSRQCPIL